MVKKALKPATVDQSEIIEDSMPNLTPGTPSDASEMRSMFNYGGDD